MPNVSEAPTRPVAVVTGGSQGLGLALTRALADRGWVVAVDARRADRLRVATDSLTDVIGVAGDISDPAHRRALADAASRRGPVDLVVNNASTLGASPLPSLDDLDDATWHRLLDVNLVAPLRLVHDIGAALAPNATIVNITSDAGLDAYEGWGGYGASKAALEHASKVLAAERPDLRVLVVDPGDMRTEMHQDAFPGDDISDRPLPDASVPGLLALIEGRHPSGRYHARRLDTAEAADRETSAT